MIVWVSAYRADSSIYRERENMRKEFLRRCLEARKKERETLRMVRIISHEADSLSL